MAARDASLRSDLRWWNLPLPGAGLILAGHLASGLAAALPALVALALAIGAAVVAAPAVRGTALATCLGAYAGFALIAAALHTALERTRPLDEALVRGLHAATAKAYLAGDHAAALASAHRLCAAAPAEPGAWRLLALVATAAGDAATATRADARATRLERRLQDAAA